MVDMDKHACRQLAENGYKNGQWPESYITWEFLSDHPRAMESRYLYIDWNSIPRLYNRKSYLRTLVIAKEEWDHLSDPAQLKHYWEPTQDPDDFHQTLGLALCWTPFHDCSSPCGRRSTSCQLLLWENWHGIPELRDDAEMTPMLLLVRLHQKSLLYPDIYYDRCRTHFTLMHDTGKGYCVGHPQKFLRALLQNAVTSGKDPSPKAKLPPAYLDLLATSPLIDSCTRKYRDWMEGCPAPEGGERTAPEEHFVWLSKDYTPYDNDPGSPFVSPDFTLGLPLVKDWSRRAGELPWVLDPKECLKSSRNVPVDSTSSMDEGKKKKKKKKKHCGSKKTGNPELKVTTRGEGADTPVWTRGGSAKDSSSSSDSQSKGDSGLGSNPSIQPHQDTDTKPRRGATPRPSPDHTKQPVDDDPLSDRGEGDGDQEMPDTHEHEQQGINEPADLGPTPGESQDQEEALPDDDQVEAGDGEEPGEPEEPQEPYQIVLQGFRTISQTLLVAYGAACSEIHTIVQKSLTKATAEDRTFVWGASGAIRHWLDSIKPAMATMEKSTKDQVQLLAEARQAGKDALDSILEYIPEEQEQQAHLTSVFPRATPLLAAALAVARHHTDGVLRNIHAQLVTLAKEHVPPEQTGALFNTILQMTCSFRQEMDNMATNQVLLPNQIVPNLWGSHRGLLEGLSLLGPPSCSASWPMSLVEWVTAVPACQNVSSSSKTPTKPNQSLSGTAKTTPDSGKKHSAKQAAGLFWGDDARRKEDAEACQLEQKRRKKSTGPILSLGDHEDTIANLLKRAPASRISQPLSKASTSGSKHWEKVWGKHPPAKLDDEPLSNRADEPKAKNCKREATPDLVVLEDDDSTPLPGKSKSAGKKGHTQTPDEEEAIEALCQCLKRLKRVVSLIYKGRVVQGKVTHGYCPFCSYASTNHRTLNNHIRMHLHLTLACGMKDCWFVTHNSDVKWKHAAYHGLNTSEPIVVNKKK